MGTQHLATWVSALELFLVHVVVETLHCFGPPMLLEGKVRREAVMFAIKALLCRKEVPAAALGRVWG